MTPKPRRLILPVSELAVHMLMALAAQSRVVPHAPPLLMTPRAQHAHRRGRSHHCKRGQSVMSALGHPHTRENARRLRQLAKKEQ